MSQGMLTGIMPLKRTNIWIKQVTLDKLKKESRRTLIPMSALIRRALENFVDSLDKPKRKRPL